VPAPVSRRAGASPDGGGAAAATLVSVNVGLPRDVEWRGEIVRTAIFKRPVAGPVRAGRLGLEGDAQADPSVHGGTAKAAYVYSAEHYRAWSAELGALEWGSFGENLTVSGLDERRVRIGDRLRIGTAEFVVTQPRLPCFKLGVRFGRPEMERRFLERGLAGFYLSVAVEGELQAGDAVQLLERAREPVSVADVIRMYQPGEGDPQLMRRLSELAALPERVREHFRKRLAGGGG
jgi:MOSC domain-containing protein YiiM